MHIIDRDDLLEIVCAVSRSQNYDVMVTKPYSMHEVLDPVLFMA